MSTNLTAKFDITGWEEEPLDDAPESRKLTRAQVTKSYSGDIDGTSILDYVMAYADDGTATFVGMERITGEVAGRRGTLVLRHVGSFADGAAKASVTIVAGAGSDDLATAIGGGDFLADPAGSMDLALSF
jgi:hypothetical protein